MPEEQSATHFDQEVDASHFLRRGLAVPLMTREGRQTRQLERKRAILPVTERRSEARHFRG